MDGNNFVPKRRGDDVVHVEKLTAYMMYRRYLIIASWFGHACFIGYGIFAGFSYGGFGGIQFFSDMYLWDRAGSLAPLAGMLMGVFIGLVCVWVICVVTAAAIGALVYWFKYKSFPTPTKS